MLASPGGTANASAVLNAQLDAVDIATALARTLRGGRRRRQRAGGGGTHLMGKISAGYVQDVGPMVMAKLHTKR